MQLPAHIQQVFFETLEGDMPIPAFETWLYANKELETILPPDDYFELIAYNYTTPFPRRDLHAMLLRATGMAAYETWRLRRKLVRTLQHDETLPQLLMSFYDMYYKGYFFLEYLGLQFGLRVEMGYYVHGERTPIAQQLKELAPLFPRLDLAINNTIGWLDDQKIVFSGERDEYDYPIYADHRTEEERR
ncbi:hypothetical protein F0L74_21910 [Chitinophaga agrisoli]|uniref:Uncharacterized protein n=1 Tax=Chitinophaga agrisoli TaxID=2607653 RepID=A0A5B2VH23_9BACT|nr:hypothetical protein [Chitinophaga agrisoli]KAA2238873.1 hypothetical protein F0L74_21910 [Chitinophaga agrisoli]